jgi:hypothetical protein
MKKLIYFAQVLECYEYIDSVPILNPFIVGPDPVRFDLDAAQPDPDVIRQAVYARKLVFIQDHDFNITILTKKLKMHRVAAKFVPHLLTEKQKVNSVMVSQGLFQRSNADKNFLQNVIIGDVTWAYGYDIETNAQSSQWVEK